MEYRYKGEPVHSTILPWLVYTFGKPNMVMAEVGVWDGTSFKLYIEILKELKGHVYLVDWWRGSKEVTDGLNMQWKDEQYDDVYQQVQTLIDDHDARDYVTVLKGDSTKMAEHIKDGELDLCFIDADHSYEGCKRDIEIYLPKVKKGGIMSGDDMDAAHGIYSFLSLAGTYTPEELSMDAVEGKGHPGVLQAVYDVFGDNVHPYEEGWYTFAEHRIVRADLAVVPREHSGYLTETVDKVREDPELFQNTQNNMSILHGGPRLLRSGNGWHTIIPHNWQTDFHK
jgi:hypothetical protein